MRPTLLTAVLAAAFISTPTLADSDCPEIAAATVAELRAGAATWDAGIEALVRSAAGAACVKAQAGAHGGTAEAAADVEEAEPLEEPTVTADQNDAVAAVQAPDEDGGKAGWKFLGFEVNSVTGSPGEKPYERKR
jgi:hypothetical protein